MSPAQAFEMLKEEATQLINIGQHIYHDLEVIRQGTENSSIAQQKKIMQTMAKLFVTLKAHRKAGHKLASGVYKYAKKKFNPNGMLNTKAMRELHGL